MDVDADIPSICFANHSDDKNGTSSDEAMEVMDREMVLRSPPCPPLNDELADSRVNLQDKSGKSLLIHSSARGLKETVEALTKDTNNIDANLEDIEGNTALIHAAQAGHAEIVELLLKRFVGIEIDHMNKLGQTALIKSAIQGREKCARILLKAGADPYRRDNGRQLNALEWAQFVGRTECAKVIGEFMVEPTRHRRSKISMSKAQENFKQVACLATIPLISGESSEIPASVRPRVRSAPPAMPSVKIQVTPPTSPLFRTEAAGLEHIQQYPYRAMVESGVLKKRKPRISSPSAITRNRPKSSSS